MKHVIVHPERCVGCMQCMPACATAHSESLALFPATLEEPRPRPRVHVGAGIWGEGFPNRCRHCDPAPCMLACLPGAIGRDASTETVVIDPDICINCASCAMACPFGVIRFHPVFHGPPGKTVAVKCDNCLHRVKSGLVPACVEACKAGALTYEEPDQAARRRTHEVSESVSQGAALRQPPASPGWELMTAVRKTRDTVVGM